MNFTHEQQNTIREGRLASLLRETVSHFLQGTANKSSFITISYIHMNKSGHTAVVHCSVFPEERQNEAMSFLKRQENACRDYIRKNTSLRVIPTIRFELAKGMNIMAHYE